MHVSYAGLEMPALPLEDTFAGPPPPPELRPRLLPLPAGKEEVAVLTSVWFSCSLTSLDDRRGAAAPCVRLPLGVRGGKAACVVSSSARAYRARGRSNSRCPRPMMSGSSRKWGWGGVKDFGLSTPWIEKRSGIQDSQADGRATWCFTGSSWDSTPVSGDASSSQQEARGTS